MLQLHCIINNSLKEADSIIEQTANYSGIEKYAYFSKKSNKCTYTILLFLTLIYTDFNTAAGGMACGVWTSLGQCTYSFN